MQSTLYNYGKICYNHIAKLTLQYGGVTLKTRIAELRKKHKMVLAYKIAKYFGTTIEDIFDFSEVEEI